MKGKCAKHPQGRKVWKGIALRCGEPGSDRGICGVWLAQKKTIKVSLKRRKKTVFDGGGVHGACLDCGNAIEECECKDR